jgi:hypothetical protein
MNSTRTGAPLRTEGYTRSELIARGAKPGPTLDRILAKHDGVLPVMAGGMPTSYPDAIQNPLSGPTISTTTYTVDFLLQNPTVIRREIADKVMANFFLDKVFAMGGNVTGGAALYEQVTTLHRPRRRARAAGGRVPGRDWRADRTARRAR